MRRAERLRRIGQALRPSHFSLETTPQKTQGGCAPIRGVVFPERGSFSKVRSGLRGTMGRLIKGRPEGKRGWLYALTVVIRWT